MKVYLESLGCARNQVDSEEMLARLGDAGWTVTTEPSEAAAIVVNTCSFIESAADESVEAILALARFKKTGRCRKLVVAGCLPERYREAAADELPEVDAFLGTGAFDQIVAVLTTSIPTGHCLLPDPDTITQTDGILARTASVPHAAYLKIAEGCSRSCTYCIIPRLRGRQKSRPRETLLTEARQLAASGVRELTLVSQDSTAYGSDLEPTVGLAELLEDLATALPEVWIRFLYGHPLSITDDVLAVVAKQENICPYFDIPIQHSSSSVLKRMGRGHDREALVMLFDKIRAKVPQAVLRTTVIVGFPGETAADFEDLLNFAEHIRFDHLGVFTYSDADDLPSHHLADPVPEAVAQERHDRLMALQMEISEENLAHYNGKSCQVLVEEEEEPGLWVGRSMAQAPEVDGVTYIRVADAEASVPLGRFVTVKIVDTLEYDLIGEWDGKLKERILTAVATELVEIETALEENLSPNLDLVQRVAGHILFSGGKRLRPLLSVLSARLCGYAGSKAQAYTYATIFEYLHAATLLHDDVVDGGVMRRGQPVAHSIWDPATVVLTGDFLLSRGLAIAASTGLPEVITVIAHITAEMSQGEIQQLYRKGALDLTEAEYLTIIQRKTAVLFEGACQVGAQVAVDSLAGANPAGVPQGVEKALAAYGFNLGMAFQMADDLLDYTLDSEALGKAVGADLREGKLTLPVIHALSKANPVRREAMAATISDPDFSQAAFVDLIADLDDLGGIAYTRQRAESYLEAAKQALALFPEGPTKSILIDIADYALARKR